MILISSLRKLTFNNKRSKYCIFGGDFTFDVKSINCNVTNINNIFQSYGLSSIISGITRPIPSTSIDNIFSNISFNKSATKIVKTVVSYHYGQQLHIKYTAIESKE